MPQFTVRPAESRDTPTLKRMRVALQDLIAVRDSRVYRLSGSVIKELEGFYAEVMSKPENRIFVATDPRDLPVGMLMVRILDNPRLEPRRFGRIDDAWVDPQWRGHGVMRALTRAGCAFLADHRIPMVMLDWANNNPPSGDCWQNLGFEPVLTIGLNSPAAILARTGEE